MKKVTIIQPFPTTAPSRKRVAAYARVSSGKDAMLHSLSAQISYYNNLIQRHIEWEFAGVYADEATTGTKDNRVEFQRILADCRAGVIDMVITKSITRFARNTLTTLETVRELKELNVDVFFEKENIHSMSGDGELMLSILASYAQEESRSASENCKWRIRKMFAAGRPNTGNMLGYRLVDGKLYIIPEEAEIVRQIYADCLFGMGKNAIANKLNALRIPAKRGSHWSETTIAEILRNEKYTGDMILQKTYISDHITKKKRINRGELPMYRIENSHEAIISKETFASVQTEIAKRANKFCPTPTTPVTYPFSGIIRCGCCEKNYQRKIANAGSKYAKPVWICDTFNTQGKAACDSQQIPEGILMTKAAEALGIPKFDEVAFKSQIAEIHVPTHHRLVFIFRDGHVIEFEWHNPSRRESWSEEMKRVARERQNQILEGRRKQT